MTTELIKGMRLIGHDLLQGFGGLGEGMSIQPAKDGRRIMWLAHEGPPKNFTGVDVSDPRKPKVVVQTELPNMHVRSNSLETVGDLMAVAYQTLEQGQTPAGLEIFDISVPENPKSISYFDCSGPYSRGVHQLWFVDGETIHFGGGSADFTPKNPLDDQPYRMLDVRDPAKPVEVARWWIPGTMVGDPEPEPKRLPIDTGFRAHNTNVYPQRPDRAYVGMIDGGGYVLDISDRSAIKPVSHFNPNPPFPGFTHTVMPLFSRDMLLFTHECVMDDGADWPKLTWLVDAREEDNLVPLSVLPMPSFEEYGHKGGRYGCHNVHENTPRETSLKSDTLIFSSLFNGGVRVHDISDPLEPKEVAAFVPECPAGSRVATAQINDVHVDENGIVYAVDRFSGGLYILELEI